MPEEFGHGGCEVGAEVRSVGQEGGRASSLREVAAHQDVDNAFGGRFVCGDSENVRTAAETTYKEDDVRISPGRFRQRPKIVDTDRYSRSVGKRTVWWEV